METKLIKIENKIEERAKVKKDFEKTVRPFIEKSLSEETRRAYGRVIKEFFSFHRNLEPMEVKPLDVIRWRDSLIAGKKSAATVSFKLSVVRSLFEYLKAGGFVQNNPALSKLVTPPKLSEDLRGRALTVKEVNYILSGPDQLDAVSEKWLLELDERLETICRKRKDPRAKLHDWALAIHRAKLEKVRLDPQLYNAFNVASRQSKPFIERHLENLHRQLLTIVTEAVEKNKLNDADPPSMASIISAALIAFHHPQLVAQYLDQNREPLLTQVLDSVLKGLLLK